jgi:hypothetical protein
VTAVVVVVAGTEVVGMGAAMVVVAADGVWMDTNEIGSE